MQGLRSWLGEAWRVRQEQTQQRQSQILLKNIVSNEESGVMVKLTIGIVVRGQSLLDVGGPLRHLDRVVRDEQVRSDLMRSVDAMFVEETLTGCCDVRRERVIRLQESSCNRRLALKRENT